MAGMGGPSNNQLSGNILDNSADRGHLRWLYLNNNELSGSIPESLVRLPLEMLDLSNNQLSGYLPDFSVRHIPNGHPMDLDRGITVSISLLACKVRTIIESFLFSRADVVGFTNRRTWVAGQSLGVIRTTTAVLYSG